MAIQPGALSGRRKELRDVKGFQIQCTPVISHTAGLDQHVASPPWVDLRCGSKEPGTSGCTQAEGGAGILLSRTGRLEGLELAMLLRL